MPAQLSYISTSSSTRGFSFREALQLGLAPDGGLFYPVSIPVIDKKTLRQLNDASMARIGKTLLWPWLGDSMDRSVFDAIIDDALNFDAPLKEIDDHTFVLELFHGPTLAFKDFAARTMGRLMAELLRKEGETLHVLTATSGDTGAAVADGFYNVEGITVWVLYPSGKVSALQEKQFTTLGGNIRALEVEGTFDDCQRMVKQAFMDEDLRNTINMTSANSINIGRLLPQMVYYAHAVAKLQQLGYAAFDNEAPVFVVPSGNFGNLTAGLIAAKTGVPARHFVAACNRNRTFYDYIVEQSYRPRPSVRTMSNAMDVGDPSNFARIEYMYGKDPEATARSITPFWADDEKTTETIRSIFQRTGYIMDPHTAVGCHAWSEVKDRFSTNGGNGPHTPGVLLATAHPAKFTDVMPDEIRPHITEPDALKRLHKRVKKAIPVKADYAMLKNELTR